MAAFVFQRRQKIAKGLTSALNTLHQHGFVHGEVNPQNVGVRSDGSAVLLCPDFSRSLVSIFYIAI
jgi:DNA-binding helix-hairpin-helix protein with protein kinase domain